MNTRAASRWRPVGALIAALVGVGLFFAIIGVFGLPASIISLLLFLVVAVAIFGRRQVEPQS